MGIAATFAVAAAAASVAGCGDDAAEGPAELEPTEGLSVSGTVFYDGTALDSMGAPALHVTAFATPDLPLALAVIPDPVFGDEGVGYELIGLPPFDGYQVVGLLVDQESPRDGSGPRGAFPDVCRAGAVDVGTVAVADGVVTEGVDFTVFDEQGGRDPCTTDVTIDACPESADRGSLALNLSSALAPESITEADNVVIALFTSLEGGPPAAFTLVSGARLRFPLEVAFTDLTPNDYVAFACYDRNGDNLMDCDAGTDEGDRFAFWNDSAFVSVSANTITTIGLDLDNGLSSGPVNIPAQDAGCDP